MQLVPSGPHLHQARRQLLHRAGRPVPRL